MVGRMPQAPSKQARPMSHAMSQPPQWLTLARVSTQEPEHSVVPVGHSTTQAPPPQSSPAGQAMPQSPQFVGSTWTSTQRSPQATVPTPQPPAHVPALQKSPPQLVPHMPQFAGS
jgi:hypothetical protein